MNFVKQLTWLAAMGLTLSANAAEPPPPPHKCNPYMQPTTPTTDFIDHGDGTVTHKTTGLMWKKCSEGLAGAECDAAEALAPKLFVWLDLPVDPSDTKKSAGIFNRIADVNNKAFAGYDDWRLPNVKELASIIEFSCGSPAVNTAIFPNTFGYYGNNDKHGYWVSTPAPKLGESAMYMDTGFPSAEHSKLNAERYMRLVRSIK